jgi:virulence-associated protein VapD
MHYEIIYLGTPTELGSFQSIMKTRKELAMSLWTIAYDLDVRGMKNAGYTQSQVTQFYNNVRSCLASNHFENFKQLSIYTSDKPNTLTDAFRACVALQGVTDADKYIKRLHLFRIEDFNDLLPLVAHKDSSGKDAIEEEIEEVFSSFAPEESAIVR